MLDQKPHHMPDYSLDPIEGIGLDCEPGIHRYLFFCLILDLAA